MRRVVLAHGAHEVPDLRILDPCDRQVAGQAGRGEVLADLDLVLDRDLRRPAERAGAADCAWVSGKRPLAIDIGR